MLENNQSETPNQPDSTKGGSFLKNLKIKNNSLYTAIAVVIIVAGGLLIWFWFHGTSGKLPGSLVKNSDTTNGTLPDGEMKQQKPINPENASYISGLECPQNNKRRAVAVMMAADVANRPDSGFNDADMVIEMPCITASITRLMGIFVCNSPKEIGSIRSARHDYITLAKGFDAILAHWGGSHFALDMLKDKNTVPDLDAMSNPEGAFFRKDGIPAPYNGFASYDGLAKAAQKLGYRMENHFEGYPHQDETPEAQRPKGGNLRVGFAGIYAVNYTYDPKTNSYLRTWGGKEDTDKNDGKRVAPKNVVVMFAASRQIEGQYNDVDVEGSGEMHAYINGQEVKGTWVKEKKNCVINNDLVCMTDSKLKFLDSNNQEIKFVPGQIWVDILEPGQTLKWEPVQ